MTNQFITIFFSFAPAVNGAAPVQQSISMPINGAPLLATLPTQMFAPLVAEPIGVPSECLLLKNMFDPATEVCLIPFPLDVVAHLYLCVCIF